MKYSQYMRNPHPVKSRGRYPCELITEALGIKLENVKLTECLLTDQPEDDKKMGGMGGGDMY